MHPVMAQEMARQRHVDARGDGKLANQKRLLAALRSAPLFARATDPDMRKALKRAERLIAVRGTTLVREGEEGDTYFVVVDGSVRVSRNGRKIAELHSGQGFGEMALLLGSPRTATVVATDDTELAVFNRKQFAKSLEESPAFARRLLEALALRLREYDTKSCI